MDEPKRKLKIKMSDLESAFEHRDPMMEIEYYLDLETGDPTDAASAAGRPIHPGYRRSHGTGRPAWRHVAGDGQGARAYFASIRDGVLSRGRDIDSAE